MVNLDGVREAIEKAEKGTGKAEISEPWKTVKWLKKWGKSLGKGFAVEWQNMTSDMKHDLGFMKNITKETFLHPWKLAKDIRNGTNLLAQGKFKELHGKVAQRLAANLEAMGIIGDEAYEKISNRIKERTEVGKVNASDLAKAYKARRANVMNRKGR